jgi:hypothetical protein
MMKRNTDISIQGEKFFINRILTYSGRTWNGFPIEGLLINSRMVQATFDDLNPATRTWWDYPDGPWDPDRNTNEFITQLPLYRDHGVLALTVNLQGGSPRGYSKEQPWHNSAINAEGDLRPEYLSRMQRVIERADELGMVIILGIFYFGQEHQLKDEAAIRRAVDNTVNWVFDQGFTNVLIEANNECNVVYQQPILMPERVHELIEQVKSRSRDGRRLLVGTSYGGGVIPLPNVVKSSDFLLLHGNGVEDPNHIAEMVLQTRRVEGYRPMPILFNEDDHFDFDLPLNNFIAAIRQYASWGCFDYRMPGEGYDEGFQSVPVNWGISSERKRGFFRLAKEITGA